MPENTLNIIMNISKPTWARGFSGSKRYVWRLIFALIFIGLLVLSRVDWRPLPDRVAGKAEASDGDSLRIGRHRIRLFGIDAPELVQTCERAGWAWACGRTARQHLLARLISGSETACDVRKRDRYGRLLAVCSAGAPELNRAMVRKGMAVSFAGLYRSEEAAARHAKSGLWAAEYERPADLHSRRPRR